MYEFTLDDSISLFDQLKGLPPQSEGYCKDILLIKLYFVTTMYGSASNPTPVSQETTKLYMNLTGHYLKAKKLPEAEGTTYLLEHEENILKLELQWLESLQSLTEKLPKPLNLSDSSIFGLTTLLLTISLRRFDDFFKVEPNPSLDAFLQRLLITVTRMVKETSTREIHHKQKHAIMILHRLWHIVTRERVFKSSEDALLCPDWLSLRYSPEDAGKELMCLEYQANLFRDSNITILLNEHKLLPEFINKILQQLPPEFQEQISTPYTEYDRIALRDFRSANEPLMTDRVTVPKGTHAGASEYLTGDQRCFAADSKKAAAIAQAELAKYMRGLVQDAAAAEADAAAAELSREEGAGAAASGAGGAGGAGTSIAPAPAPSARAARSARAKAKAKALANAIKTAAKETTKKYAQVRDTAAEVDKLEENLLQAIATRASAEKEYLLTAWQKADTSEFSLVDAKRKVFYTAVKAAASQEADLKHLKAEHQRAQREQHEAILHQLSLSGGLTELTPEERTSALARVQADMQAQFEADAKEVAKQVPSVSTRTSLGR